MKHFKMEELVRCYRDDGRCRECPLKQRASRLPSNAEENLRALVKQVLDPAREKLGKPITVNSGFRCTKHNAVVGGVANSQHMRGEAADIACADNEKLAEIIETNGKYDQLIRYKGTGGKIRFVHVSWKRNGMNRKMKINK